MVTGDAHSPDPIRVSPRVRVFSPANFRRDGEKKIAFGTIVLINAGGLYLATPEPVEEGDELHLSLSIPGRHGTFQSTARVVNVREIELAAHHAVPGAGCAFVEPPPLLVEAILDLPA